MKFTKLALTLLCSLTLFCGCAKLGNNVVLKVNDTEITAKEFYGDFNKIKEIQLKNAPKEYKKDTSYTVLALKDRYTNDVIVRTLLTQEFDRRDIQATEEDIEAKKEQIISQIGSKEQFEEVLKKGGISKERLKSDLTSEVRMDKLIALIDDKPVTDADALKYYNANKNQFAMPETVQVSHILIDTNPESIKRKITDADKDAKLSMAEIETKVKEEVDRKEKLAKEVREKAAKNPNDFETLAKQYSEDPASAQQGGDLGYIVKGQMVPEFNDAAFSLKVGTISPLVKTQYGEHIILVKDKTKAGIQSYDKIKNDLKQFLAQQKRVKIVQDFVSNLKSQAKVEYIDDSLNPNTIKKQIDEALAKEAASQKEKEEKDAAKLEPTQKQSENSGQETDNK